MGCNLASFATISTIIFDPIFLPIKEKAARLAYGLVSNHGFNDGNKRIACTAFVVF